MNFQATLTSQLCVRFKNISAFLTDDLFLNESVYIVLLEHVTIQRFPEIFRETIVRFISGKTTARFIACILEKSIAIRKQINNRNLIETIF